MAIRVSPRVSTCAERGSIRQSLLGDETLQSCEPVIVVMRSIVGLAAIGCGLEFFGERRRPFLPGEMTFLGQLHCKRECLCLPRLGKDGPLFVARNCGKG